MRLAAARRWFDGYQELRPGAGGYWLHRLPRRGSVTTRFGVGPYALERAVDGTTTVRPFLTGAGRYKGPVYRDVQVGMGDTWTVNGWISPAE